MKNVGIDKLALVIGHLHTNSWKKVLFSLYCNDIKKVYIPETPDLRDFAGMKSIIEEERNRRMTFKDYTTVKMNAHSAGDDSNHDVKNNETTNTESGFAHEQNDSYWLNEMTIIYSRIPVSIYAASQHYSTYRKLHRIGRLRGNLLWDDSNASPKELKRKKTGE
ncbi:hypothetical protein RFI_03218 [Reticulomyxa filosa]|uniref:Uncharacterized protein n=1 Tax=Reticulomyxa filosa TaxID=46433 RepID=X6P710_RETFI|nr:hypothetical protein RFI_03218 [Reticulomyxa filosa]|eukprot:ETO33878.1 hypothetical protein RFI_03218 [Reticulomyxa filosa]